MKDEDFGLTPLQVLTRAWERVSAGSHPTAQEAIGRDSAVDAVAGSPLTKAWGLLVRSLKPDKCYLEWTVAEFAEAYLGYQAISDFGQAPNRDGELEALRQAIAFAKAGNA